MTRRDVAGVSEKYMNAAQGGRESKDQNIQRIPRTLSTIAALFNRSKLYVNEPPCSRI